MGANPGADLGGRLTGGFGALRMKCGGDPPCWGQAEPLLPPSPCC